jgi:LAGLIDADG endonuclease
MNCGASRDKEVKLNPWFVTGFTDAEGSFNVSVSRSSSTKIGWRVQMRFIIELHKKDLALLTHVQSFFKGIGTITNSTTKEVVRFSVVDQNQIINVILPHFNKYPLQSAKLIDFKFWLECVNLIKNKKHITVEGMNNIVSFKGIINHGNSEELKLSLPDAISLIRPSYSSLCNMDAKLDPYWISGFIEGDGSFIIKLKSTPSKLIPLPLALQPKGAEPPPLWEGEGKGLSASAVISIGLDIREEPLLYKIKIFFNSFGSVYSSQSRGVVELKIFKLQDLLTIIPHFEKYPLIGFKSYNFGIWKEIVFLISEKAHRTFEGIQKIKALKNKLNIWK